MVLMVQTHRHNQHQQHYKHHLKLQLHKPAPLFTGTQNVPGNQATGTSVTTGQLSALPGINHGFGGVVNSGGIFPFGMTGPYQNTHQSAQYTPNWNFGYNVPRFPQNVPPVVTDPGSVNNTRNVESVLHDSKSSICEGTQNKFNISVPVPVVKDSQQSTDISKESLNEDLLAMQVSTLLSKSSVIKDAISKSLQNTFPKAGSSTEHFPVSKVLNDTKEMHQVPLSMLPEGFADDSSRTDQKFKTSSDDDTETEQSPASRRVRYIQNVIIHVYLKNSKVYMYVYKNFNF